VVDSVVTKMSSAAETRAAPPTVFISYSHDSLDHMDHVLTLANLLRRRGIDTVIDVANPEPEGGFALWSEREIQRSDFVLVVCSPEYQARFNDPSLAPTVVGRGVVWEARVIRNLVYEEPDRVRRFLPVVTAASDLVSIPLILKQSRYYDVSSDADLAQLIEHLRGGAGAFAALREIAKPYGQPVSVRAVRTRIGGRTEGASRARRLLTDAVRTTWFSGGRLVYAMPRVSLRCVVRSGGTEISGASQQMQRSEDVVRTALHQNERVILLGNTGAGKTMFTKEVMEQLLTRADIDESQPIPLLINLRSWAVSAGPIAQWLAPVIHTVYGAPLPAISRWLEDGLFALIFDGLDEVGAELISKCVHELNRFMEEYAWCPILMSSRTDDYLSFAWALQVSRVIEIQPVSSAYIARYVAENLPQEIARRVSEALDGNTAMVHTPLALAYLLDVCSSPPHEAIAVGTTLRGLADLYVRTALREDSMAPEAQKNRHRLEWIANSMNRNSEAVFYLESISQRQGMPEDVLAFVANLMQCLLIVVMGGIVGICIAGAPAVFGGMLFGALCAPMICALPIGGTDSPVDNLRLNLGSVIAGVARGLFVPWSKGMVVEVLSRVVSDDVKMRRTPYAAMAHSARIAAISGTLFLGVGVPLEVISDSAVLPFVLLTGIGVGMRFGGNFLIRHFASHVLLRLKDELPWTAVSFLDSAARSGILLRVGRGYSFAHPSIQAALAEDV
jgi:hypothetical protein